MTGCGGKETKGFENIVQFSKWLKAAERFGSLAHLMFVYVFMWPFMNGFTDRVFVSRPGKKLKRKQNKQSVVRKLHDMQCNIQQRLFCKILHKDRKGRWPDRLIPPFFRQRRNDYNYIWYSRWLNKAKYTCPSHTTLLTVYAATRILFREPLPVSKTCLNSNQPTTRSPLYTPSKLRVLRYTCNSWQWLYFSKITYTLYAFV